MKKQLIRLCFVTLALASWPVQAQSPQTVELVTSLVKDLGVGTLLDKVFDKLLADKTPKEAARPKVRELYASLLEVRDRREALRQAIQERIKVLGDASSDADSRALSRDEVIKSASDAKGAFLRLKSAFEMLHVDLDASDPEISNAFGRFMNSQQPIYVIKAIDVDNTRALDVAQGNLEKNTANLQDALKRFRSLTQKVYPDFGELLSPGLLR